MTLPKKKGGGGLPQNYNESNGRYGKLRPTTHDERQKRLAEYEAAQERIARKYDSDKAAEIRKPPKATSFNRPSTAEHRGHWQEVGCKNEKEYVHAAVDFFNNGRGTIFFEHNGRKYYKFDDSTRLLCVCDTSGSICTFFKTKTNTYFKKLSKQKNLEEIK